jgi:hypothetical protein
MTALRCKLFIRINVVVVHSPAPSSCGRSRRRIHLWRRQGLADRLGSEFREYAPQGLHARRERVTIVSGDVGKLFGQSGGFFVGQVKVLHNPDMGVRSPGCDPTTAPLPG